MNFLTNISFITAFIFIYAFFFLSFYFKKKTVFLLTLLSFIIFYDFIFINISPWVSSSVFYLIKSWQEYLCIFLLLNLAFKRTQPHSEERSELFFLASFIFLTVLGCVIAIANGIGVMQIFLGWRMYMLPLLWAYLIYRAGILARISARLTICFFVLVSVASVGIGIYQNLTFDNNLKNLWFYSFINELNPIADHAFDFIRDDELRVTSIFVSPLIYSTFLSYSILMVFYYMIIKKGFTMAKVAAAAIGVFLIYGEYLSRTRIGFIILMVGVSCSFIAYLRPRTKFGLIVFLPVLFLALTLTLLILGITEDLSALGRLVQYATVPANFVMPGMGYGAEMTNVFFDSFYISVVMLFGVFALLYLGIYFSMLKRIYKIGNLMKGSSESNADKTLFYASYGFAFSFIFTFGFHFTVGAATMQIFYMMLFFCIAKFERAIVGYFRSKLTYAS